MEKINNKPAGIFTTNRYGPKILIDEQGEICRLQDSKSDIVETAQGLLRNDKMESVWFVVLFDKDKADRVRNLRSFGKTILEAESAPMINQYQHLTRTPMPGQVNVEEIRAQAQSDAKKLIEDNNKKLELEKKQIATDSRRYAILSSKLRTKGGKYIANADPNEIKELESLEVKLGMEELEEAEA